MEKKYLLSKVYKSTGSLLFEAEFETLKEALQELLDWMEEDEIQFYFVIELIETGEEIFNNKNDK